MLLHIQGQVQGVGFRPLVYRLARAAGLRGWVSNGRDGVRIHLEGDRATAEEFLSHIKSELPAYAVITRVTISEDRSTDLQDFTIRPSDQAAAADLLLPADRALCASCRADMNDPGNRRHHYAFTTCLHCGPRYSIIRQLPYDRERTSMDPFAPCPDCTGEVADPTDRRHISQTNSCPACPIHLWLEDPHGQVLSRDQTAIPGLVAQRLDQGHIVAVKGIGGYLLLCDARNRTAIRTLRQRKHRPDKPLAIMVPGLKALADTFDPTPAEHKALESAVAPIVLLPVQRPSSALPMDDLAPGLCRLGVMLPYAPLFHLLLQAFPHPVVATSGNVSGAPICTAEPEAREHLAPIADLLLMNDREIVIPQDDSVVQFSRGAEHPIILRRSRGMAPAFLPNTLADWSCESLALGAHMKGAFALHHQGHTHISQYLGNLESHTAQETYQRVLQHLTTVLEAKPDQILTDAHPGYFSHQLAHELGQAWERPVIPYPHHLAHFAAVLAENDQLRSEEPILGVIWDGTGYGDEPEVAWGGEFFLFDQQGFRRVAHLEPFPLLAGDKMAREPRLSALALTQDIPDLTTVTQPLFQDIEWGVYQRLLRQPALHRTTSMGRLFDGVAALLGCGSRSSYEGQAAMQLEALAIGGNPRATLPEGLPPASTGPVAWAGLIRHLVEGRRSGQPIADLARQFHQGVIQWIDEIARACGTRTIAMSGGVWQNALLHDLAQEQLGSQFTLLRHRQLSPNDENIAYGQLALHWLESTRGMSPNLATFSSPQKKPLCA